jgi:DNA-binding FadR family transcriptional regulator
MEMMRRAEGDTPRFAEADLAFHLAVGQASGNLLVGSFGPVIRAALKGLFALSAASLKQVEKGHAGSSGRHAAIVTAIATRDEDGARAAMLRVIAGGQKHAGRSLRDKG